MIPILTILFSAFALFLIAGLFRSLWHSRTAGTVLIDAGPNPARGRNTCIGMVGLLMCLGGLAGLSKGFDPLHLSLSIAGAISVIALISNSRGRLQVRENGLWLYSDLVPWNTIVSHHWGADNECALQLHVKTLPFVKKESAPLLPLIVPDEFKTPFEQAIQKHTSST
jgi:hypothetical protein